MAQRFLLLEGNKATGDKWTFVIRCWYHNSSVLLVLGINFSGHVVNFMYFCRYIRLEQ